MDVAFIINPIGLEGLGATLVSLLRNCKDVSRLTLWFFCSECKVQHKDSISQLLACEKFSGKRQFIDFDAKKTFGHLKSLHGDWTTYGRLLIPNHINEDVALYLDADLIVSVDVLQLKEFTFNGQFLGAVPSGTFKDIMERNLFLDELHQSPEAEYFNAGVLLFNLRQWKAQGIQDKWQEITVKYPELLISHDQTLLNAVCGGQFAYLPSFYNNHWFPGNDTPANMKESIIHFVGSPKPWDAFGKQIHLGYNLWHSYSPRWWNRLYTKATWNKVLRTWRIRNSILLKLKSKIVHSFASFFLA